MQEEAKPTLIQPMAQFLINALLQDGVLSQHQGKKEETVVLEVHGIKTIEAINKEVRVKLIKLSLQSLSLKINNLFLIFFIFFHLGQFGGNVSREHPRGPFGSQLDNKPPSMSEEQNERKETSNDERINQSNAPFSKSEGKSPFNKIFVILMSVSFR